MRVEVTVVLQLVAAAGFTAGGTVNGGGLERPFEGLAGTLQEMLRQVLRRSGLGSAVV